MISVSDWISIICAVVALIVTVIIAVLQIRQSNRMERFEKRQDKRDEQRHQESVKAQAVSFISKYYKDRGLIPLCAIATMYNDLFYYNREMYREFCCCTKEVQNRILEYCGLDLRVSEYSIYEKCLVAIESVLNKRFPAYTLKMSYKTDYKIDGFFEYVVPPLEGFWWQDNVESVDYTNKSAFNWISIIRMPDFIAKKDFDWAVETASKKKKMDCSGAEFLSIDEGLCVQIMHIGAFDDEPATVAMMDKYLEENGYVNDFTGERRHHEIYLSDPRKVAPEKCKTVIRHPIKKA